MDPAWLGQVGEELACRALRDLGWRVLHRNLRAPEAELDAVCRDGSTTVVVEVKTGRRPRAGWAPGWRPSERIMPADVARRLSVWLAAVYVAALRGKYSSKDFVGLELAGLYWHFVDLVWVLLFTLVYLM